VPAGDLEGHHDAVTHREIRYGAADLLDDPEGLVADDVTGCHERAERLVEV